MILTSRLGGLGRNREEEDVLNRRLQWDYEKMNEKTTRKDPLDENDPKYWMKEALDQFKTLTTAVSVPLLQNCEGL